MENTAKHIDFLEQINRPMSKESIAVLYSANNINFERCELYSDYIQSLLILIFDTYLGDDITDSTQQINHFKWCWGKNNDNFSKEGVNINNQKLYEYFLEFMLEVYYPLTDKNNTENTTKNILKLWSYMFDYNSPKSSSDIDTFVEIYRLFEKSLKPTK